MDNLRRFVRQPNSRACRECGEALQPDRCGECQGSGRRSVLLLFSRGCDVCNGSGQVWRCPDADAHASERLRKLRQSLLPTATRGRAVSSFQQQEPAPKGAHQCWNCKGRGTIAGKKRIPNPRAYLRHLPGYETIMVDGLTECGVCQGRGWLGAPHDRR